MAAGMPRNASSTSAKTRRFRLLAFRGGAEVTATRELVGGPSLAKDLEESWTLGLTRMRRKERCENCGVPPPWPSKLRPLLFSEVSGAADQRVMLVDGEQGIRQGCLLSPGLFNLVTADLKEELRKGLWGGVRLGGEKVYTLAFADDLVLLAEDEEGMRAMMARLKRYMIKKGLVVNVEKSKGLGEKNLDVDMLVDDYGVWGMGVEVWGWRKRDQMEKVQEKYLRWLLGVNWRILGYMIKVELQREKLRTRAERRA
ncbi:uncharacterized protein LOC105196488 [Solenopsis invicta]|uniref:uncharacterized protein LOC105196488 n=1 Tax=Solenopsis invicta TaxID=13686 RepID=UPI000595E5AD|nr:uncharacterized protein LOC105196488 [Solenopsis invicta]